jgi:hypothetical protein
LSKDYSNADLLDAFVYDSLSTHVVLTRFALARNIPSDYKDELMMLLMRKYRLDDPGLKEVRVDMRDLMRKYSDFMEWPRLQMAILRGVPEQDRADATTALDMLVKNDAKPALMRLSVLPIETQRTDRIAGITLIALSELAAQAFRADQLDSCIDDVRRMLEIMPQDEVITKAYRELLARRTKTSEAIRVPEQAAPQTLVAPKPVVTEKSEPTAAQKAASDRDILAKAYGTSLGYYFTRKASGADARELQSLLEQMKVTYKGSGLDLSIIDRELADLGVTAPAAAPAPTTVAPEPASQPIETPTATAAVIAPKPATVPTVSESGAVKKAVASSKRSVATKKTSAPVAPKPALRPVETPSSEHRVVIPKELERAWRYYQDAAARDISDHEKVEILSEILKQFGEQGAERVNKELERIRRRMQQ